MPTKSFEELRATGALPSPPGVGMEILRITVSEDCSVDELARVIQSDPALTGRLLQVANSALAGGARPCSTMKEATMRLGLRAVRNIALGFSLVSAHRAGACLSFDYGMFWSQSLARAVAAYALSQRFGIGAPPEVFIAALLSDLGSLALATVFPREFGEILAAPESATTNGRAALEQQRFGIDHREVTAAMMREWKLPEAFSFAAQSVGASEAPAPNPRRGATLATILWIAERFAGAFVLPEDRPLELERVRGALASLAGSGSDLVASLWSEAAESWRRWGHMLEIVTTAVPAFGAGVPARAKLGCPLLLETPAPAAPAKGASSRDAAPKEAAPVASRAPTKPPAEKSAPIPPAPPRVAAAAPASETVTPSSRARILVVDDDPSSLKTLSALLERVGHQVLRAGTGREALKMAMQVVPQIVIADRHMPDMDGVTLCKSLRAFEAGRRVYIILLTSDEAEDHVVEGFDAGADDYVLKPFRPRILLARMRAGMRVVRLQERIDADKATMQRQVAELGVLNRKLESASLTDVLTDLPNRRHAMEALREGWERSVKDDEPISAVMIDLDKFKRVNDTFGHDVGDAVLRETAKMLRTLVEPPSSVCRIGGEEFVVILPGTGARAALQIGEKLRHGVAQNRVRNGAFDGAVTASCGVSTRDGAVRDFEHLLKLADEALYRAKEEGRNLVRASSSEPVVVEPLPQGS
jgi:diguanylate cyclase (GGDEF)-like protein